MDFITKRPNINHPNPIYWDEIREKVLKRDNYCCRACSATRKDGFILEVHHRHYNNFGKEDINDLTTLCRSCHELFTSNTRQIRYESLEHENIPHETFKFERKVDFAKKENKHGIQDNKIESYRARPFNLPQRPVG